MQTSADLKSPLASLDLKSPLNLKSVELVVIGSHGVQPNLPATHGLVVTQLSRIQARQVHVSDRLDVLGSLVVWSHIVLRRARVEHLGPVADGAVRVPIGTCSAEEVERAGVVALELDAFAPQPVPDVLELSHAPVILRHVPLVVVAVHVVRKRAPNLLAAQEAPLCFALFRRVSLATPEAGGRACRARRPCQAREEGTKCP